MNLGIHLDCPFCHALDTEGEPHKEDCPWREDIWWQQQDTDEQWRRHHERLDTHGSRDSGQPAVSKPVTKDVAGNDAPF